MKIKQIVSFIDYILQCWKEEENARGEGKKRVELCDLQNMSAEDVFTNTASGHEITRQECPTHLTISEGTRMG